MNLIPNGSFEAGLIAWESTPTGVTFVKNAAKRFVILAAEKHSAAICSDPVHLVPGAAYHVSIERALRGDCEVAVIGRTTLLRPNASGEIVAEETPVRVQVTAKPGHRVGLAKVLVQPVGARARIQNVRSTAAFRQAKQPFEILCEIKNTGSEVIDDAIVRFVSSHHELLDEHRQEQRLRPIPVNCSSDALWSVAAQRLALAPFTIELQYGGGIYKVEGTTLRHIPRLPPQRLLQSVAGGKRWFSVASRGLQITAHDTDLDFGPALLSVSGDVEIGVIQQFAQITSPVLGIIPLWSKVKDVSTRGVTLTGRNTFAAWSMLLRPDLASKGIALELSLAPKQRLIGASVELFPFQTMLPLKSSSGAAEISTAKEIVRLSFATLGRVQMRAEISPASGLTVLRSEPTNLTPASSFRVIGLIQKPISSIIRGE